jgi:hypothetical protein
MGGRQAQWLGSGGGMPRIKESKVGSSWPLAPGPWLPGAAAFPTTFPDGAQPKVVPEDLDLLLSPWILDHHLLGEPPRSYLMADLSEGIS